MRRKVELNTIIMEAKERVSKLINNIKQAIYIDGMTMLTEVSFKYEGYKYSVPNATNQDIKIAVNCINNEKLLSKVVGFKPIEFYVNGYGVLCLRF